MTKRDFFFYMLGMVTYLAMFVTTTSGWSVFGSLVLAIGINLGALFILSVVKYLFED